MDLGARDQPTDPTAHRIVIVGGGAGGLELATGLGDRLGRRARAHITLVDRHRTHVWKPKLHEIAAGSMDMDAHELDYMAQAHWHHFSFRLGELLDIDRGAREIVLGPYFDEQGDPVTPHRRIPYDTLVLAIGSLSNDFGTPGVSEHALRLETPEDARRFHSRLVNACIRAQTQTEALSDGQLHVAIIGAGATGVELAAELHRTTRELVSYGLTRVDPDRDIRVKLIEAAPRVLPALPERLSRATHELLNGLGVEVYTHARVSEVGSGCVRLSDGRTLTAALVVWAAGVKAPDVLRGIGGLETNPLNQLLVSSTLQTTRDPNIFAIGDCAACPWPNAPDGNSPWVPPRAQAAHQQAAHLRRQIVRHLRGQALAPYAYRDFGSLVSLGKFNTVGNLMGGLIGNSLFIEGGFAKLMYVSLYKLHELALHGWTKTGLDTVARMITRRTEPPVKLH